MTNYSNIWKLGKGGAGRSKAIGDAIALSSIPQQTASGWFACLPNAYMNYNKYYSLV